LRQLSYAANLRPEATFGVAQVRGPSVESSLQLVVFTVSGLIMRNTDYGRVLGHQNILPEKAPWTRL
jgi:hypothetical protein